jgi:predicted phosphoribosyltransferase
MRKPGKLVLAVPVAPTETLKKLRGEADDIVCLEDYEDFGAIGLFYSDFHQVSDTEVIALLAAHPIKSPVAAG